MRITLLAIACACLLLEGCASTPKTSSAGWKHLELRDYRAALGFFDRALESSQDAELHAGRARALFFLGRFDGALESYETAIAREPRTSQWHIGLGIVKLAQGNSLAATAAFDAAIDIDPSLAKAYYNRGSAMLQRREFDSARADFTKAILLDPNHSLAYNSRGVALAQVGRLDAAIDDFQRATRIAPMASAHGNIAAAHHAAGRPQEALSELNTAIRMERKHPLHYTNRGRIYLDLGRADLAVADFEEALALAPRAAQISQLLANARGLIDQENGIDPGSPAQAARAASFRD